MHDVYGVDYCSIFYVLEVRGKLDMYLLYTCCCVCVCVCVFCSSVRSQSQPQQFMFANRALVSW